MRYQIYLRHGERTVVFYDTSSPAQEMALIDPVLHIASDVAGSFEATFPLVNRAVVIKNGENSLLEKMVTKIFVTRDDDIIWSGRLLELDDDFDLRKIAYFEGAYSYFNDTAQVQKVFSSAYQPKVILSSLLSRHNSITTAEKAFVLGNVQITMDEAGEQPFAIDYCSTLEALEHLRERFGGHMRVRYSNESEWTIFPFIEHIPYYIMERTEFPEIGNVGEYYGDINTKKVYRYQPISATEYRYVLIEHYEVCDKKNFPILDWFSTYDTSDEALAKAQSIDFGVNLMDFAKKSSGSTLCNAILPLGKVVNSGGDYAISKEIPIINTTVESWWGPTDDTLAFGDGYKLIPWGGSYIYEKDPLYSCTGLWDSALAEELIPGLTHPHTSLEVKGGEVYFLNCYAGDGTTMYIVTEGYMGNMGTWVSDLKNASSGDYVTSELKFHKITIPEPKHGKKLFLNMSALKAVGEEALMKPSDLNMSIYSSRKIPDGLDERITLNGVGTGECEYYLDSDNNLITPTPEDDGWFLYPKIMGQPSHFMPRSDFPPIDEAQTGDYYCDTDTGEVYQVSYISLYERDYIYLPKVRAYQKEGLFIIDPFSIKKYSRIEKIIAYDDVINPSELKQSASADLLLANSEDISVEVSALDLAILQSNVESPDILDPVRVRSKIHGIDLLLPVQERDIPFNDLGAQTFSIGYQKNKDISDRSNFVKNI